MLHGGAIVTNDAGQTASARPAPDATELMTLPPRFRRVYRLIEENRYVLPRAFLVPAVRVIPDRVARLAWMERFAPAGGQRDVEPLVAGH